MMQSTQVRSYSSISILFICFLFSLETLAQNQLIELDFPSDCQRRLGERFPAFQAEPNLIVVAAFKVQYNYYGGPDLEGFSIELGGNFTAADVNNSTCGALFYTKTLTNFNSAGSIRQIAQGEQNVTGPGVYSFTNVLETIGGGNLTPSGNFYVMLEVSPDADESAFWVRNEIVGTDFLFDPPTSISGFIPVEAGSVEAGPEEAEVTFEGGNGFIRAEVGPSDNEGYRFEVTNGPSTIINEGTNEAYLIGLQPLTEYTVKTTARRNLPGCTLEEEIDVRSVLTCFQQPGSPVIDITSISGTNFRPETTNLDDLPDIEGVGYRQFRVIREVGSPRLQMEDGEFLISPYTDLYHHPYGSFDLGNGNYYVNTQNGRITGLTAGVSYELDTYFIGYNEVHSSGSLFGFEDCVLYSAPTRTIVTTCEGSPDTRATNLSISNIGENSATLSWTNGDGEGRLVVMGENIGNFNSIGMNGEEYNANNHFPDAPTIPYDFGNDPKVIYAGNGSSVTVTGLTPGTFYKFFVLEYQGNGFCRHYLQSIRNTADGTFTTLSNDLAVSTLSVTNRTPNSAVAGGNIELINNVTVTERGLVWSTASNPDLTDNSVTAGTGSGAFTATLTGMSAGRRHFVRAYAIANGVTFYGNDRQFFTVVNEPLGDPTNLVLTNLQATSGNNLSASFDWDGSGADGYLLLYRRDGTAPTTSGIEDGVYPEDLDLPSGTFVAGDEVIDGTSYTQNVGVFSGLTYHYLLIPVAADQDNNPQTYNYKTDGVFPTLTFSTDIQAPVLTDFQPTNNANNVPANSILTAQFNENIVVGSGDIELVDLATGDPFRTITVPSGDITISNNIVSIDPGTLPNSTAMYVTIATGAFEDNNGNKMTAFNGKNDWKFTTAEQGDVTAPMLTRLTPENGSDQLPVTSEFEMTFNESVTLGTGNITIKRASNDTDVQVIPVSDPRVSAFKSDVTITPNALPASTDLYFTIDNGAITDLSGNAYEGFNSSSTWAFTTAEAPDEIAPSMVSTSPADDQTDVALNGPLAMTFDEPVQIGEGFVAIRLSSNGTAREIISTGSNAISLDNPRTTATIQPASALPADTELYVEISNGAFTDDAENKFAGISDATTWSFTTTSGSSGNQPQILTNSLSPSPGATNVAFGSNLSFAFNENVLKGTGDLLITNEFTGETAFAIDVTSSEVSIAGNVVTIDPAGDLSEGHYSISIPSTAFKDSEDNFFDGLPDGSWVFATPQVAPTLVSLSPTNSSTEIALDATLTLTFSEEVAPGSTGSLNIRRVDNGALITSYLPESSDLQYNGASVSLDLNIANNLYGVAVFVQIENGVFQDMSGNPYIGFVSNNIWSFTLEDQQDITGPQLNAATLSPADDSNNIAPDTDLVWSFNETVLPSSGQIFIKEYSNDQTVESYSSIAAIIDQGDVTLPRTSSLPEGHFYIEMEEGAFQDGSNKLSQAVSGKETWDFFTVGTPPSIDELIPVPGATNVGQVITAVATFDEPIMAGAGSIIVRNFNSNATIVNIPVNDAAVNISGNTLSVDIDLGSIFDIPVYIQVVPGAITDLFGNGLTELNNNTWNYTLVAAPDVTPPALFGGLMTALSPQRGSGTTPSDELLEMTFNEEVQAGTGSILLYRYSDDQLLQGVAANSPAVSISGSQVTIDPPQLFDDVQTYVLVSDDAFQDNSGNFFAGISNKDHWYFYPEISRPVLVSMSPEAGSTNLPVGEAISFGLNFSEDIEIDDTGSISILRRDNNALAKTIFLNDPSVQVQGSTLIFDVTFAENEFFSEMEMYVSVNGTFITDLNGNNVSSFGSFASTGFTMEPVDVTNPFIIQNSYVPAHHSNNVAYNTNLSFEMSEEVVKGYGNIHIRNLEDDAIIQSIDVNSPEVSISGTTVTINPASDLPEVQLYIEVEDDTFEDSFGNIFSSPLTVWRDTWRLYMFEEILEVVDLSPAHGSTNIQVNEPLTFEATFSHPIEINTDNPGDIFIRYNQGNGARYTIPATDPSVSADGNVLRFDLTLDPGTSLLGQEMYVQLGYGVVRDVNGISKNLNFSKGNWHFTNEEATPPVITSLSPADDATGLALDDNFVITFNEDVTKLNFYATLHEYNTYNVVEVFDNNDPSVTVSGNQVTINPDNDLVEGQFYYISLSGNSVTDFEGAGNTGISGRDSWNFGAGDTDAPQVVSLSPGDNASEVDLDANFTITFDEPVFAGGIDFIILRRSNGSLVEYTEINDARVTGLGTSTLVVDFNNPLQTAENYYITFGNGIVEDALGNKFTGWSDATTWSFSTSTADIINPLLSSLSPADDEGDVATNSGFVLTLNEDIQWGLGDILLKEFDTDNLVETFNSGSANFTLASNQLVLTPSSDLSEVTAYYIEVASDAIVDFSGNPYTGFTGNSTWNFTTLNSDVTAPTLVSFSPADDLTDVSKDLTELQMVFDEPLVGVGGFIYLRHVTGSSIAQSFNVADPDQVTVIGNTVTLRDVALAPKTNYYIQNSSFIRDLAGNAISTWVDQTVWNFGTFADTEAPTVTSFSPPSGTTGLTGDESFTMTFSEDLQLPTFYSITIVSKHTGSVVESFTHANDPSKVSINGNQVTINPDTQLDPFREYYITVSGFEDDYDNGFAGFSDEDTWDFVVGELDNERPTITSLTPANGATDVPLNIGTFSMTFSEDVFPGPWSIFLRNVNGNSVRQEFALDSDDVVIEGNTLTILNVNTLSAGWEYWLQGGTVLEDEAGNLLDGWVNNASTWSFTTEELPTHAAFSPADGAVDVSASTDLVMTFNKPVQKGTGSIAIYDYIEQTEIMSFDVASSNVAVNNDEVTITIPGGLPDFNLWVYVLVDDGAFVDNNGNSYAGINSRFTWDFELLSTDQTPPAIVSLSPADNAVDVDTRSNLVIEFDEDVFVNNNTPFRVKRYNVNNTQQQIFYPSDNITVEGNTITIEPIIELPFTNQLWIEIPANSIKDEVGNAFAGISVGNRDDWDFTMVDALFYQALSPTTFSVDVDPTTPLEITFPRNVVKGSGSIRVFEGTSINELMEIDVLSEEVQIVGNVVTITPVNGLPDQNLQVHIQIDAGAFEDEFGNPSPIMNNTSQWRLTLKSTDESAPQILSLSPADDEIDVAVNSNLVMTFDEPVFLPSTGTRRIRIQRTGGVIEEQFDLPSARVSGYGTNVITINPTDDLLPETGYYVTYFDVFEDQVGNLTPESTEVTSWNFTTESLDVTPPQIVSVTPPDNATDIGVDQDLVIEFDEGIVLGNSSFLIKFYDSDVNHKVINYASDEVTVNGSRITINPNTDLAYGSRFWVQINAGTITDTQGNGFAGILAADKDDWDFTTAAQPPSVTSLSPEDGATGVSTTNWSFQINFDIPIDAGLGTSRARLRNYDTDEIIAEASHSGYIGIGSGFAVINFNALAELDVIELSSGTRYYIEIEDDLFRNQSAIPYTGHTKDDWDFTTEIVDNTPPSVVGFNPADEATGVVIDANLVITFDEPVQSNGTVDFVRLFNKTTGANLAQLATTNSNYVIFNENTITLNSPIDLPENTEVYVTIPSDGIEDVQGNTFGGWSDNETWNFTTSVGPKQDQTITFDPLADKTFGDEPFTLSASATSTLPITFTVASGPATLLGSEVTITGAGEITIAANQAGDVTYNPAPEVIQSFTVAKTDQIITITEIADKLTTDTDFDVVASTTSSLPLAYDITGPASLNDQTVTLDGTAGMVTVTVSQEGNTNYNPASATETFEVTDPVLQNQTITFDVLADKTFGDDPFTLSATATSALPVIFTVASGPAILSGNEVTITGAGQVTIAANQAGDETYHPALEVTQSFMVAKADQIIYLDQITDKDISESPVDIVASTTSGLPLEIGVTGPATLNATSLTLDDVGTVTVTVSQAGNDNFNVAVAQSTSFLVTDASRTDQAITFPEIMSKTFGQAAFTLNATASSNLDVDYTVVSGPISISGSTVIITGAGTATIAANQSGNASFNPAAEVRRTFSIAKGSQTISFSAISDKTFGDDEFDITATTSTGLTVSFSVLTGPASVNGNTVQLTGAGTVEIAADQSGNANYNAAPRVTRSFDVAKAGQVVIIQPIAEKTTLSDPFDVVASASSSLPLTYAVTGPATANGATITLSGVPGEVTVTATQAGDANYNMASTSTSFTVVQGLLPQSITFATIDDQVYGATVTLNATTNSNLPIAYEAMTQNLKIDGTALTFTGTGYAAIKAVQAGDDEHQSAEAIREFNIARAPLTLKADDKTQMYGQANLELTITAEGLVYEETIVEAFSEQPSIMTPATEASTPGTYLISLTGGEAANYTISKTNGDLTITKATLTVIAADAERSVGQPSSVFSLSYEGFVNDEDETSLITLPIATSTATSASGIGSYDITPQGGSSALYSFEYEEGTLTITGATLSGQVDATTPLTQGTVTLWKAQADGNYIEIGESTVNADGSFTLDNIDVGNHTIEVAPTQADQAAYFSTYYTSTNLMGEATTFDLIQETPNVTITMVTKPVQGNDGQGSISGVLGDDPTATGGRLLQASGLEDIDPIGGAEVWLVDQNSTIVGHDITDELGRYDFTGLQIGSYTLQTNYNGLQLDFNNATVEVSDTDQTVGITTLINSSGEVINIQGVVTSLGELPQIEWVVYPNPARDYVHISIDQPGEWSCRLHNLNGQLIYQIQFSSQAGLQLGHLPKGIYLLTLNNNSGQQLHRRIRLE